MNETLEQYSADDIQWNLIIGVLRSLKGGNAQELPYSRGGRVKPLSHRIVRLLDRTIGCYLANVRPIGNVCFDRQQRSHTAIGHSSWWYIGHRTIGRTRGRAINIDWRISYD